MKAVLVLCVVQVVLILDEVKAKVANHEKRGKLKHQSVFSNWIK